MLKTVGYDTLEAFVDEVVPASIRIPRSEVTDKTIPRLSESEMMRRGREIGAKNKIAKSFIGQGYHNAVVPPVILRNVRAIHFADFCCSGDIPHRSPRTQHGTPATRRCVRSASLRSRAHSLAQYQPEIAQGQFAYGYNGVS